MANSESAKKRIRANGKRVARNQMHRGRARTAVKQARMAIDKQGADDAKEAVVAAIKALDHAASKGTIHKNNAARRKGRLMKQLAALEAGAK